MYKATKLYACLLAYLFIAPTGVFSQVTFPLNSDFSYLKGSEAASLPSGWYLPDFDDASWSTAAAPFWYGDGAGGTLLSDMAGNYTCFYLRGEFTAANTENIYSLSVLANYDDGFAMWINGEEVLRANAPQTLTNDALAPVNHESGSLEGFELSANDFPLSEGPNTVAVQVFNTTMGSTDVHFNMALSAVPELPPFQDSQAQVAFSHDGGFYNNPFQLTLTAPSDLYTIRYTLDGSDPAESATAFLAGSTADITIDPESTSGRPRTPAVVVRAALVAEGFAPSLSRTRTYLFVNKVRSQSFPGSPWPSTSINGQRIDLEIDPEVINDPRYSSLIEEALTDIPSLSLVTDPANLFDPSTGIYVNAKNFGIEWERDCSLELLDPVGQGFQVNGGVRIRGGASRDGWNPKHAFRLFFRSEYGDSKLRFPLFGDEGADTFDKIDLRTEQNYSWSKDGGSAGALNTFIKDIYSRKMQGEMGQPYTRSRYYHLYLNGLYWGLFMTEERPEANFAESYFGDDDEDYDVVKVTTQTWPYYNIATDGNLEAWSEVYEMCNQGFTSNSSYFRLEGKDENGNPLKDSKVLVDIDNLIDYMAMTFYTGNVDGPVSAWFGEAMPNNYYAIYNRKNDGKGFVFIAHDQEHSMFVDPIFHFAGININRVTIPEMSVSDLSTFQPQWLHAKLTDNAEYRLRFADRVYDYFHNDGIFTPDRASFNFNAFAAQIDKAIIAESARWGDAQESDPRTRDDDWLPVIQSMNSGFFPFRTGVVINQLDDAGLLSTVDPPLFFDNGGMIIPGGSVKTFKGSGSVLIKRTNNTGTLYYTTNGDDPRLIGGEVRASSKSSDSDVSLDVVNTTVIKSRIRKGEEWSSLAMVVLENEVSNYDDLAVTELHYHPPDVLRYGDTIPGKDMEFIEFKNIGKDAISLSNIVLDSAIYYVFPSNTFLPPGKFYVVASKPEIFYEIYGMNPNGNYSKNFRNSGDSLIIIDPDGAEILSFSYSDQYPWPLSADGDGYSLVSVEFNPLGDPSEPSYWRASHEWGGSPFADDLLSGSEDREQPGQTTSYQLAPNPFSEYIRITSPMEGINSLQIYDMSGKLIHSDNFKDEIIIHRDQMREGGIYFFRLSGSEGVDIRKVIVI